MKIESSDQNLANLIEANNYKQIQIGLASGNINPNSRNDLDFPCLTVAVLHCWVRLIRLLIKYNADVNATEPGRGMSPLHLASMECNVMVIKILLDAGANVNLIDADDETCLFYAVRAGRIANARILLINGSDVNHINIEGNTVLMCALESENYQLALVRTLLARGASLNLTNAQGQTPIQIATQNNRLTAVKLFKAVN